jgi:hypothetical protein
MEWRRRAGGRLHRGGSGRGGRLRTAALVGGLSEVSVLGPASLRTDDGGRFRASSRSDATEWTGGDLEDCVLGAGVSGVATCS